MLSRTRLFQTADTSWHSYVYRRQSPWNTAQVGDVRNQSAGWGRDGLRHGRECDLEIEAANDTLA
jgi:hypothetical protein